MVYYMKKAKSFISRHLVLFDYVTWAICLAAVIAILLLAVFAAKLVVIVLKGRKS